MTNEEIQQRFERVIDQYFHYPSQSDVVPYIGGVLQAALFILPLENYYELKRYTYKKHGYDPGGVQSEQMTIQELYYGQQ